MIIVLKSSATEEEIQEIVEKIKEEGLDVHISRGKFRTIIGVIGEEEAIRNLPFEAWPAVEKVMPVLKPYRLVSLEFKQEPSVVNIEGVEIGGGTFTVMAGPCSVESREQLMKTALSVKEAGAKVLRRCIQTENLSLFFSGPWSGRSEAIEGSKGGNGTSCGDRSHGCKTDRFCGRTCRHSSNRCKEHAELQPAF